MQILAVLIWFLKVVNDALKVIDDALKAVNYGLDITLPWIGLVGIIGYIAYSLIKIINKYQKKSGKNEDEIGDIFSRAFSLISFAAIVCVIFWGFPAWVYKRTGWGWAPPALRWIEFGSILTIIAYIFGHKYGEKRWIYSTIGHITVIFFGWLVKRWAGILFISLPLILTYYTVLYHLAVVTLPVNNPEDKAEKRKRFLILVSYTWGAQFPLFVVGEHAWKKPEIRIPGNFMRNLPMKIPRMKIPGLIWTKSHQVVGITSGVQFKRVDGPGVVFMGKMERPFQIIDLRTQVRTSEIDVVSKDGISFKVRVFTAFRIDSEPWDKDTYDKLRQMNGVLRGADKPSHTEGSFPFSSLRVQAALSTTSTRATGDAIIYWDQWALNVIEDVARKVISQKRLDELWRPANDEKEANALDKIADEIKGSAYLTLRAAGILLFVARVVNFRFPTAEGQIDHISKQQISTWGAEWERKRTKILDEAQAESDRAQQEARAYAESILLNSIAEGLQKTHEIHPRLPRYVIAVRFLSALQNYIRKMPKEGEGNSEINKRVEELETYLRYQQSQFLSSNSEE